MLNLSKSGAEVKLWKYLIFLWWTKCRGKMHNQGYETLQPGKRKENGRVQRKVKPCDELPPNLRSQSNTIPENESSWNRYLLHICIYMTWSIISDIFQHWMILWLFLHHPDVVLLFRRGVRRLQQKSADFEKISLCLASAFRQYWNIHYAGDNHHRSGIKAPTNLPDILCSGSFVLDTVAPEVACGKLLPGVAFLSFSFVIMVSSWS